MDLAGYTDYCTCFYDEESKKVYFYDEIQDRTIRRQKVKDEKEAEEIMQEWVEKAPKNIICQRIDY